jgi:hypothetical protein
LKGFKNEIFEGKRHLTVPKNKGSFSLDSIDVAEVTSIEVLITSQLPLQFGYTLEVHLDQPDGTKLGELVLPVNKTATGKEEKSFKINLQPVTDGKFHTLYFVSRPNDPKEKANVGIQWIQLQSK